MIIFKELKSNSSFLFAFKKENKNEKESFKIILDLQKEKCMAL